MNWTIEITNRQGMLRRPRVASSLYATGTPERSGLPGRVPVVFEGTMGASKGTHVKARYLISILSPLST